MSEESAQVANETPAAPTSVDLLRLRPGTTVVVYSRSSTYWLTITGLIKPVKSSDVRGVSVQSTNKGYAQHVSPYATMVGKKVELGKRFRIGDQQTSEVVGFELI